MGQCATCSETALLSFNPIYIFCKMKENQIYAFLNNF